MIEATSGVYILCNKINGKFYIGSSTNLRKRRTSHFHQLRTGTHKNKHLQSSYNLYGQDVFEFSEIEYCDKDALIGREQYYMDVLQPPYNIRKYAESNRGLERPPTTDETRAKMRASQVGRKQPKETIEKRTAKMRGGLNWKSRETFQIDLETGVVLAKYESVKSAADACGVGRARIRMCASGDIDSAGGYRWTYGAVKNPTHNHAPVVLSEESRAKISAAHKGKKYPPEFGAKISAANKGRKASAEFIANRSGENSWVSKKVAQLDIESGAVICVHVSIKDAAKAVGVAAPSISMCVNGKRRTSGGFKWKYADG